MGNRSPRSETSFTAQHMPSEEGGSVAMSEPQELVSEEPHDKAHVEAVPNHEVPPEAQSDEAKALEDIENLELDVFQIKLLAEESGACPYERWYRGLRDITARARVRVRIKRLERGLFGTNRSVGEGVNELKIDYGPGYRVYYAQHGNTIIVLIGGGDKSTQDDDIKEAKRRWKEHKDAPERFRRDFSG